MVTSTPIPGHFQVAICTLWFTWQNMQQQKKSFNFGSTNFSLSLFFKDQPTLNNMKNQHFTLAERWTDSSVFYFSLHLSLIFCWRPCPSHLPLRLSLLLASLTHLRCLICPFQSFCLTFPSFFQPFLLFSMDSY